ncbi:alpha-galactosidase [Colletotrichum kahawae]|uniref:Alpha-galactosidase n=1 Tax=Colletotrichum kahawae TaxID=34407 RepID=A0AAE0DDK5_COLKA|nr:alpha-galactosidase [Colletotrichum kahawae]
MSSLLPREDAPGTTTQPSAPTASSTATSGMTLPLLLAIAIGGGVLLFICLAFLLVALAGRRHRAAAAARSHNNSNSNPNSASCSPRTDAECGASDAGDRSPRTPSPRPRRLTKAKPGSRDGGSRGGSRSYMDMAEIQHQRRQHQHRSLASIIGIPRSKTFNVFGTADADGGQQRGGHLRRNNSWIDEDAIHGPRVQKDDRRLSIRDSFILRTPTLPDFSTFKEEEAFANEQTDGSYAITQPRPVSLPAPRGNPPRIPLPRTASYELAERLAAAARGGPPVPLPSPQGPRPAPLPRLRHKTTESDLAEILRSTEERLMNGTPSNSRPATRQRANSASAGSSVRTPRGSPTKGGSPTKSGSPVKMMGLPSGSPVRMVPRSASGSPVRMMPRSVSGSPVRMVPRSPTKPPSPIKFESSPERSVVIHHVGQALDAAAQQQLQQQIQQQQFRQSLHQQQMQQQLQLQQLQRQQQRTRTPSPHKGMVAPVLVQTPVHNHRRNTSQSSAVSDADSLFGETTPEVEHVLPTGLSSPSRRSDHESPGNKGGKAEDRCMSMASLGSNASSSLSTLYSVNEPEDDSKTGGQGGGIIRGRKPKGLTIDTAICDPFITPPLVPPRSPKRQSSSLPPLRRISPPEDKTLIEAPFNSRSASNSPVPRPLDVVKRSSVVERDGSRLSMMLPSDDFAPSPETIRPKSVASMKPVFLVSSTSVASMKASPGTSPEDNHRRPEIPNKRATFGQKPVFPPPLNLRPGHGSPNRDALAMGSAGGGFTSTGASPTLRSPARDSLDSRGSHSPTRRPLPSPELPNESRHGSPTPGRYKRRGMASSPIRERMLSRQPANPRDNRTDKVVPSTSCPSIMLNNSTFSSANNSPKRGSFQHRDFAVMGLQSTVAQLRRMNSQMSTLSAGSSVSDPDSPTLPNFRGGGFSPDRSNSRISKIGRQNYLSLGLSQSQKAKRNPRAASIKGARNSIAVIKSRPGGSGPRLEELKAAVEENENENDEETARPNSIIRGPRPLNPTPRSAVRGAARASTGMLESPTRRAWPDAGETVDKGKQKNEDDGGGSRLKVMEVSPRKVSDGLAGPSRSGSNLRI